MAAQTIDEVIHELGSIVDESIQNNDRLGIFAYIYKRTTEQIRDEIIQGNFENNERLEKFDVLFANYYLNAYKRYKVGKSVSESWKVAFDAGSEQLTIIQHTMLGMNAHINFDLAVAAADIMDGKSIDDLRNDFFKVNEILASLLDEMQLKISRVSYLMFLLDWIGGKTDEKILNFSMVRARTQSWKVANELWSLMDAAYDERIREADYSISELGLIIKKPPTFILNLFINIISWFEIKKVSKIIRLLGA